jgi:hypothetical protein
MVETVPVDVYTTARPANVKLPSTDGMGGTRSGEVLSAGCGDVLGVVLRVVQSVDVVLEDTT